MIAYKALLLTILVAGAVTITGNAYAQSNTERLQNIDKATEDILEAVGGIPELLGSIQDSITGLVETIAGLSSDVTGLSSNVTAINSNVAGLYSEINDLSASSTSSSLRIESAISKIEPNLVAITAGVETNRSTLDSLSEIMVNMNEDLRKIEASLVSEDDSGLAQNIEYLISTTNRNELNVSDRLDKIEATLAGLSAKLDAPTQPTVSSGRLSPGSATYEVTSYTYKNQGDKRTVFGQDIYDLEFTFSCDKPVTIDTVSTDLTQRVSWIITDPTPDSRTSENYLEVENRILYNSRFAFSASSYQVYNIPVEFNYESLLVGDTLIFESQQYDLNSKIANADKSASDGYTITVEYLGERSTSCSFSGSGGSSTTPGSPLSNSQTLTLTPTVDTSTRILHPFSVDVTCDDDPVEITDIAATAVGDWNSGLTNFAKFDVTTESGTKTSISFEDDGELGDHDYPISFSEDITISGELPGATEILILVSYNTVSDGSCEEST